MSPIGRGKLRKILQPLRARARALFRNLLGREVACYDLNLIIESLRPEYLRLARHNVLIPHPEWFNERDMVLLRSLDGVFALTRHAVPIFRNLGLKVWETGFTSDDRLDATVPRERTFFHLAGRSPYKGTERLLVLWRRHPEWPCLTVVQNPRSARPGPAAANIVHRFDYLSDAELKRLQNANAFHVCCSETEGFGHYIVEGMSVGAVVLTTDAPPMNELVTSERGVLVGYDGTGRRQLATTYQVSESALEAAVQRCLAMSDAERAETGKRARAWFESNDAGLPGRLRGAIEAMLASS